jgi:Calcineurin-like phosphoesterase
MAGFSLIHITDLHIAVPQERSGVVRLIWRGIDQLCPSRHNPYAWEAIKRFLAQRRESTDVIVLSGDISDDGTQRNLDEAFRLITGTVGQGDSSLDGQRSNGPELFIMPGNHDRFNGDVRLPGGTAFDTTFGSYWRKGLGGVQSLILAKPPSLLALVASDFCLQEGLNPVDYLGRGNAYDEVIWNLVEETNAIRYCFRGIGVVWISHFPPMEDVESDLMLKNGKRLIEAAIKSRVGYMLCGHLHRDYARTCSDDFSGSYVEIICTGTAASTGKGEFDGYWIQRLDVEVDSVGNVSVVPTKFRYQHSQSAFVPKYSVILGGIPGA